MASLVGHSHRMRLSRAQCVLYGIAGRRDNRVLGSCLTYFARNLAHDLSCSFTNTLPFEEKSRSGAPKGSQACAATPAARSKSGAPLLLSSICLGASGR
jgi:hypothetical protein